jgi:hypothetical protein
MSARHNALERRSFHFTTIRCPHCDSPINAEVTGLVSNTSEDVWDADSIDIACSKRKCDDAVTASDTQSLWQPIIDAILSDINKNWYFGTNTPSR